MITIRNKRLFGCMAAFALVLTGTYNAVVINSKSDIAGDNIKFAKRLDESYGIVTPGRNVATTTKWKKLPKAKVDKVIEVVKIEPAERIEKSNEISEAAIKEDLDLNLTEVVNPKKWKKGLSPNQFSGNLVTNRGIIENLSISLPGGLGISVSFSEMSGNVFEYDMNGDVYSGMLYQMDQGSYMVALSNGPLEGTRLRFANSSQMQEQTEQEPSQSIDSEVMALGTQDMDKVSFQF